MELNNNQVHSVIINMIHESLEDMINNNKVDKNKLDIVAGLIFEHIFHRTYNFVSDELNEFRELKPHVDHHVEYVKWSTPIVFSADKIIKKLKQIGVILSVLFTMGMIGNEIYKVASTHFNIDFVVTPKSSVYDKNTTK